MRKLLIYILLCLTTSVAQAEDLDPPEILLGERLFLETRFAQYFASKIKSNGDVNASLDKGDPALDKTMRFFGLPPYQIPFTDGPFAGQTFNCRTCHLVDEHLEQSELGMRSYSDFASRSPLPTRDDGMLTTVRNSPALVDASIPRTNFMLHHDGEFATLDALVRDTLTNRNMGWLPGEKDQAVQHICKVVREDDGKNELAEEFGGLPYTAALSGKTESGDDVTDEYLIQKNLRIDIENANCETLFSATANLIAIYIDDLRFAEDESIISPYDLFLKINQLPSEADEDQDHQSYSENLIARINELEKENKLKFVTKNPNTDDGAFQFHEEQAFEFGETQLEGMRIFFSSQEKEKLSAGNCVACHPAPHFTDFDLHNTGATQVEYDAIHGQGSFNKLEIPSVNKRDKNTELYLPATHKNPNRQGIFRSVPSKNNVMATDLGAWNILFNSDFSIAQQSIYGSICLKGGMDVCTSRDDILKRSIAAFKTPSLRNLGHSAPYMHNGQISDLHAVISFYLAISINTRQGQVRNSDEDIAKISIKPQDIQPLAAFLISLYEDYN